MTTFLKILTATVVLGVILVGDSLGYSAQAVDGLTAPIPNDEVPLNRSDLEFLPLTNREVVVLMTPRISRTRRTIDGLKTRSLHAYQMDLDGHKCTRTVEFEESISDWPWYGFSLSPNRRLLLCLPIDRKHLGRLVDVVNRTYEQMSIPPNSEIAWLPDSQHFLAFERQKRSINGRVTLFSATSSTKQQLQPELESDRADNLAISKPLGMKGDTVVFGSCTEPNASNSTQWIEIHKFRLEDDRLVQGESFGFSAPGLSVIHDSLRMNIQGNRLLWSGFRNDLTDVRTWCLFTSNLDGSESRQVCSVAVSSKPPSQGEQNQDNGGVYDFGTRSSPFYGCDWMPDGKTLCYVSSHSIVGVEDR